MSKDGQAAVTVAKAESRTSASSAPPSQHDETSSANPFLYLQRSIGNQAVVGLLRSGRIQPKLTISQPGDPFELEADRVADQVMRMPLDEPLSAVCPHLQRTCAACSSGGAKCSKCAGEEEHLHIHRKEQSASGGGDPSVADNFLSDLGPGRPLDSSTRAFFEPRFGRDFSSVRIHTDSRAAESARAINACAFTLGPNIVFGSSEPHFSSSSGMHLLSHELAHVVQQSAAKPAAAIQRQANDPRVHSGGSGPKINRGAQDGYPTERWSEEIERQYKIRGDFQTAAAIRRCRETGGKACQIILTASDTIRLLDLAVTSKGDEKAIRNGLGHAVPVLGMLAGPGLTPPTPPPGLFPPPGVVPPPVVTPPLIPPTVTPPVIPPAAGPAAELGTDAAVAAGAGLSLEAIVATAGIAAIVAICVVAGYQLWKLGKFQEELRARGFIIIGDPLTVCIGGCHLPARPQAPDFRDFPKLPDRPLFPPSGPDTDAIERWIRDTTPQPDPKPTPFPIPRTDPKKKDRRKECMEIHPGALQCGPFAGGAEAREEAVMMYLLGLGYDFIDMLDIHCEKMSDFGPGVIQACGLAPGESWHCTAKLKRGSVVISIFACLCCAEDGSTSWEWRGAHMSPGK